MASYLTTLLPGAAADDGRRRLGMNSLGQSAFCSRVCRVIDPAAARLAAFRPEPCASPAVAGLAEIGEAEGWLWFVEGAVPCVGLDVVRSCGQGERRPMPVESAGYLALRLAQACAALGSPHLRLSPRNVYLQPGGEPYLVGAGWARLLPPEPEDTPYLAPFEDARADAFAVAELVRQAAGGADAWDVFPAPVRAALERAGAGPRRTWMLTAAELAVALEKALHPEVVASGAARLTAYLQTLRLPPLAAVQPDSPQLRLSPPSAGGGDELQLQSSAGLGIDGRIVGPSLAGPARPVPVALTSAATAPSSPSTSGLELDERAMEHAFAPPVAEVVPHAFNQPTLGPPPKSRTGLVLRLLAGLVILAGLAGGAWYWMDSQGIGVETALRRVQSGSARGDATMHLDTVPSGATLTLGEEVLGTTPYIGDNDYPDGDWAIHVELEGYEPLTYTLKGGTPTRVKLQLVPKKGGRRK